MHVPRTPTDLGHIVANVIKGIEPRDAIERIIADARGEKLAEADEHGTATALIRLAELLNGDKATKAKLAELKKAVETARAEQIAAAREKVAVDKARQDLDAERSAQAVVIARELKDHQAAMAAANAELASVKKVAADLLAKAKADSDKAAAVRKDLERRLDLIRA